MIRVIEVRRSRESLSVLQRIKRWEELRGKKVKIREHRLVLHMLNAAWKGYQRGQDIGVSWILSESHSGRISTEAKEAKRIAQQVVSRLKELGFGAELRPDPDTYMTVSKEGNSFKTTLVYQLSVQLSHIQRGDVKTLRKEMFGGWQDLPRKERRRGYKRKAA